jgi:hypothetical protein
VIEQKELSDAMRQLPRETASPGFTSDVLRRTRRAPARPFAVRLRVAFAMAAVFVVIAAVQVGVRHHQREVRLAALRAEQQQIAAEIEKVKAAAQESEPVVVLEDGKGTRVIMDLDSAMQPPSQRAFD